MGSGIAMLGSLFLVPFTGVMVRYRAGYYPRLLAAPPQAVPESAGAGSVAAASAKSDNGSSAAKEPAVAPVVPTFLGVGKRIKRIEGWTGLWKGFLPTLLSNLILVLLPTRVFLFPIPWTWGGLASDLFHNSLYIPGSIFVYRAIVTTHKLEISGTSIRTAMEALFTDHERKKPWVLWSTPGLLPAILLNILLRVLAWRHLRQIIEPDWSHWPRHFDGIFYLRMGAMMLLVAFFTAALAPLDVIATRLVIQRNYGNPVNDLASEALEVEVVDLEKAAAAAAFQPESEELAVQLRRDKDLYQGIYDCATRIIREEGWRVLYRGWWMVLLCTTLFY